MTRLANLTKLTNPGFYKLGGFYTLWGRDGFPDKSTHALSSGKSRASPKLIFLRFLYVRFLHKGGLVPTGTEVDATGWGHIDTGSQTVERCYERCKKLWSVDCLADNHCQIGETNLAILLV